MEQILKNIEDPSWWFTGVFFILIGILLSKLLFSWLPKLWGKVSTVMPTLSRRMSRWKEKRILYRVKKYRQQEIEMHWLIARYWFIATVFIIYAVFALISFLVTPILIEDGGSKYFRLILVIPLYLLEILAMWERSVLGRAIEAHIKWNKRISG